MSTRKKKPEPSTFVLHRWALTRTDKRNWIKFVSSETAEEYFRGEKQVPVGHQLAGCTIMVQVAEAPA